MVPGGGRLIEQIANRAQHDEHPVVVVGDLNTTDRSRDYRVLTGSAGLRDAVLDGWGGPSQIGNKRLLLIRIDNLLITPSWCADDSALYRVATSDQRSIEAVVGPCAVG